MTDDGSGSDHGSGGLRESFAVTTFRITKTQWTWLRQQALERASDHGFGKADASEVLRELLEGHIKAL